MTTQHQPIETNSDDTEQQYRNDGGYLNHDWDATDDNAYHDWVGDDEEFEEPDYDYDDPDEKYGVYDDYGDEAVFEKTNKQKGLAKFK